ncbi:thymidylate synthase (FAD) [Malonomonas rubra DSM 5091]|uniref:Flavin-dependent thymidylate synthase n=1 Tax=Malonomonas rubra DSM 5091 TaxID=1122189 RepID=A0A1M6ITY7_MALRU|nr:FAD-dependent thymidylate synthase [Malonomonas rubra]SHJ37923.1 thymidylate synthase (FAD) [Malonomonas rubra DSM 5091]
MKPSFEKLSRPVSPQLDDILGIPFPVLDDGFVRVIDYMGNDSSVVQAARVSYGAGTKKVSEDRGLIRYLLRNFHTTPFEMCTIKFHLRVPMDAWRQWIRHRTASVNEYSTRYSLAIDQAVQTGADQWRSQSTDNKQGSGDFLPVATGEKLTAAEQELYQHARTVYRDRIDAGVAREQARKDLPLSTYTEAYWEMDLHNLLHFLALRMDPHAQLEIRRYAEVIGKEIVSKWVPATWEAFMDYRMGQISLSQQDQDLLSLLIAGNHEGAKSWLLERGWIGKNSKLSREGSEFVAKVEKLGIAEPFKGFI